MGRHGAENHFQRAFALKFQGRPIQGMPVSKSSQRSDHSLKDSVAVAQQYRNSVVEITRRQVNLTVPVEVSRGNSVTATSQKVLHGRLEGSVSIAQQHRYTAGADITSDTAGTAAIGYRQILLPVPIEVVNHHGGGARSRGIVHCDLKRSIPIAQ